MILPLPLTSPVSSGTGSLRPEAVAPSGATRAQRQRLAQYAESTGLEFVAVDSTTGIVLGASRPGALTTLPTPVLRDVRCTTPQVRVCGSLIVGVLPLPEDAGMPAVALTVAVSSTDPLPTDLVLAAVQENWTQSELEAWAERQSIPRPELLRSLLELCWREASREDNRQERASEFDRVRAQLDSTEKEIELVHSLSQDLQLTRNPSEVAEQCLARIHALMEAGGCAVWLEESDGGSRFIVHGNLPFDELGLAQIAARFEDHDWSTPLVRNGVDRSLLGADFPGLRNLVLVPIAERTHRFGWIACCNLPPGREFGAVERTLMSSVARMLGTHVRNVHLDTEHESLLLCFVRSLVFTIDAKDPYTRGHSERVALVARRLGQELRLPEEDLRDLYVSGMLHDVGKIGVDDRILRKSDKLTDDEFRQVQQHPVIGYSILSGLKSLRRILPGVRNHHERIDGTGYPDRLKGDEIPLMARIIAVADSFDAMTSDRSYRPGLPAEELAAIFRDGAGTQWDRRIIEAYFACADDIRRLCATYTPGSGCLLPGAAQ